MTTRMHISEVKRVCVVLELHKCTNWLVSGTKIQNTVTKHTNVRTSFKVDCFTGLYFAIILIGVSRMSSRSWGKQVISQLQAPLATLRYLQQQLLFFFFFFFFCLFVLGFFFKMILITVFPIGNVRKKSRQDGKCLKVSCCVLRSTCTYCIFRDGRVGGLRLEAPLIDPEQVIRLDR